MMHFTGEKEFCKDLFESLEDAGHFLPWYSFRKLLEIFQTNRYVLRYQVWSLLEVLDCFDTHLVKLLCFFIPYPPHFLQLPTHTNILLPLHGLNLAQGTILQYLPHLLNHSLRHPLDLLDIICRIDLFVVSANGSNGADIQMSSNIVLALVYLLHFV